MPEDTGGDELPYLQAAIFAVVLLAIGFLAALAVAVGCAWAGSSSLEPFLTRDMTPAKVVLALNWVAITCIAWHAFSHSARAIAISSGAVFGGAGLGLFVREVMLTGVVQSHWLGAVMFICLLAVLIWHTSLRLNGDKQEELDVTQWLAGAIVPIAFGFALLVALFYGVYFARFWNEMIGMSLGWRLNTGSDLAIALADELVEIVDKTSSLLFSIFAVASSVTTVVVIYYVTPRLGTVWAYLGLKKDELSAARRLRSAALDAVLPEDRLGLRYTKVVNVTPDSNPRQLPFGSTDGSRAIIKVFMPTEGSGTAYEKLQEMVATAQIELEDSLFFIYPGRMFSSLHDEGRYVGPPLAYGTGAELRDLLGSTNGPERGRFSGQFTARFVAALEAGEEDNVRTIVNEARSSALEQNPKDDVLLSTVSVSASEELKTVLRLMSAERMNSILLTSDKVPHEFAILEFKDVSQFLLPPEVPSN